MTSSYGCSHGEDIFLFKEVTKLIDGLSKASPLAAQITGETYPGVTLDDAALVE